MLGNKNQRKKKVLGDELYSSFLLLLRLLVSRNDLRSMENILSFVFLSFFCSNPQRKSDDFTTLVWCSFILSLNFSSILVESNVWPCNYHNRSFSQERLNVKSQPTCTTERKKTAREIDVGEKEKKIYLRHKLIFMTTTNNKAHTHTQNVLFQVLWKKKWERVKIVKYVNEYMKNQMKEKRTARARFQQKLVHNFFFFFLMFWTYNVAPAISSCAPFSVIS